MLLTTMNVFNCEVISINEKFYINIPLNLWSKTEIKKKSLFARIVLLSDTVSVLDYECRLLPKGDGKFLIPLGPKAYSIISKYKNLHVEFELIKKLKSINCDSPYSVDNPIRNKIEYVAQPSKGYCIHAIVSMLTGLSNEEVCERMQARAFQASLYKLIETLDYYGINHGKITYKFDKLPNICIINTKMGTRNHYCLYFNEKFYDPTFGIKKKIDIDNIISYIEIFLK